tara:strand:+ start:370 stop:1368 length:999 start_codon:yes stop_codon:yes gene_type:complete
MLNTKQKRNDTSSKKINLGHIARPFPDYSVVGKPGKPRDLLISQLESILGQRITSVKKAKAFLKKAGGWDWSLYSPILVARIRRQDGGYDYYVYDGDHRLLMYVMVFGDEETIPCYVVDFKSTQEVAERFNQINARRRTAVTKEQQFICDFYAQNKEVQVLAQVLASVGLRVADDKRRVADNLHEVPAGSSDPAISANALRECVKVADNGNAFNRASKLLKDNFQGDNEVRSELVQSLTLFFKLYEISFAKTNVRRVKDPFKNFCEFFGAVKVTQSSQQELAELWKKAGGRVHHKEKECIALGMLEHFLTSPQGNMLKTHFNLLRLEKLIKG